MTTGWFDVDREGLASLLDKRGREFALYELIQNGLDQNVTWVSVDVEQIDDAYALVRVADDDPEGFADLSDAYTVFAHSRKRANPLQRGRFNLGEKLVLALCRRAEVASTKGTVVFDAQGRHQEPARVQVGSVILCEIAMTAEQTEKALEGCYRLLPPKGITLTVNGVEIPYREPLRTFRERLDTEIDVDGKLRLVNRLGEIDVHEPLSGETPMLYELGIPVCPSGHRWHVDVAQKVPLTLDRENVRPTYITHFNHIMANRLHDLLTVEDVAKPWAQDALASPFIKPEATKAILDQRFGEKAAVFTVNDPEANMRAMDEGYTVVTGSQLSADQWASVRRAREALGTAVLPATAAATPTPVFRTPEGGAPGTVPEAQLSPKHRRFVAYARWLHERLVGGPVAVSLISDPTWKFGGAYGKGLFGARLYVNARTYKLEPDDPRVNALLIHEFGHAFCGNHFSEEYHRALCDLAVKFRALPAYTDLEAEAEPVPTSEKDEVEAA